MIRHLKTRTQTRRRAGASAIEFALIAPLMILFTFGLVELGRMMLIKQTATHATREGARMAVRPSADRAEVVQRVQDELSLLSISGATIETDPSSLDDAEPGAEVTVRVRIDIGTVSWIPDWFEYDVTDIVAESCMRRESTD